jgi:hypothetical protein
MNKSGSLMTKCVTLTNYYDINKTLWSSINDVIFFTHECIFFSYMAFVLIEKYF